MSDQKNLINVKPNDIVLHDNGLKAGSLIDQAIKTLNEEQVQALGLKAGEEIIALQAKEKKINLEYVAGRKVAEDHIDVFNGLEKNGKLTGQKVISEINTGAGKMRIESKSGATCFVATASYQDPMHSDVVYLRYFRDVYLKNTIYGEKFINWYWSNGPKLARFVSKYSILRIISKFILSNLVWFLKFIYK